MSEETSRWYRDRLVGGPLRPFDPDECDALEREIGLPLPSAYRSFLQAAGGAWLDYSVRVPECEPEPLQSFDDLHQLGRDANGEYGLSTLLGEYRHSRDWWIAQHVSLTGLLPIARNGGNDTLFLDLNPATHGQLHVFVHAISWPGYLGNHVFTKIADDFDAYLDSLFIDPDMAEHIWAGVADDDSSDPQRKMIEERLDKELPGWRTEPWATSRWLRTSPLAPGERWPDRRSLLWRGSVIRMVLPSWPVDTGWMSDDVRDHVLRQTPLGRLGSPQDTAHLVEFLCSQQGQWISGQLLKSNGGFAD